MKKYLGSFMKNGELFETIVMADHSYEAREIISISNNIPMNFEIGKNENEKNHVSAVIELIEIENLISHGYEINTHLKISEKAYRINR